MTESLDQFMVDSITLESMIFGTKTYYLDIVTANDISTTTWSTAIAWLLRALPVVTWWSALSNMILSPLYMWRKGKEASSEIAHARRKCLSPCTF